jgi:hypothetical protein
MVGVSVSFTGSINRLFLLLIPNPQPQSLVFKPTFMLQKTVHSIYFKNDSNISMPIKWYFDDLRSRSSAGKN